MYYVDLFTGAGGGSLASQHLKGWKCLCYVEFNDYCQQVIQARIRDGYLDDAPIWDDVRTFRQDNPECGEFIRQLAAVENLVITAGFPCQPFSAAGSRESSNDERDMWPDTIRIIREIRPRFVFLENVRGLLSAVDKAAALPVPYFGTILRELAQSGYDARWRVLSASELGAPHQRDRVWIACADTSIEGGWRLPVRPGRQEQKEADANGVCKVVSNSNTEGERRGQGRLPKREGAKITHSGDCSQDVADPISRRFREGETGSADCDEEWFDKGTKPGRDAEQGLSDRTTKTLGESGTQPQPKRPTWWEVEPDVGRLADGIPHRVAQLRAAGNGQVSAVAAKAWDLLTQDIEQE